MWSIGIDSLRSPSTGTSNWVPTREFDSETFSLSLSSLPPSLDPAWSDSHSFAGYRTYADMMHLMLNTLAIEGEDGYSKDLLPRLEAGYERFLTNGLLPDGSAFEVSD
jgi:hypothetical protein